MVLFTSPERPPARSFAPISPALPEPRQPPWAPLPQAQAAPPGQPPHTPGTTEPRNAQSPLATPGPWRQLRLPVPRGRGPLLGAGSWAGLGRPSTVGGPFLPLHLLRGLRIAWWPVRRQGRGWRVPAASRRRWPPQPQWGPGRQGGRWLQPARGAGPAGHPQDAALHGGPGTGPAAAAGSPRTVAGPGPLLWQPPGRGHGRHSPFHQDPAPRPPPGGRGQRGLLAGSQGWAVRPVQRRPLLVPWRGLRRGSQPARGGHRPRGLPRRGPGRPRGCPHPAPAAASRAGRRARGR